MFNKNRMDALATLAITFGACHIEFSIEPSAELDGWIMRFPWCDGDIACHKGTYGTDKDVETFRFPWDNGDVSVLSPTDAIVKVIALHNDMI